MSNLDAIPEGFVGKYIDNGQYEQFTATGKLSDPIVFNEWTRIWNSDIVRNYKADFEVYGEKAHDPDHAEVDIFMGVH